MSTNNYPGANYTVRLPDGYFKMFRTLEAARDYQSKFAGAELERL